MKNWDLMAAGAAIAALIGIATISTLRKDAPIETQPTVVIPTPGSLNVAPSSGRGHQPPLSVAPQSLAPKRVEFETVNIVPRQCLPYKRRIINESRTAWGLDGFPATFAAQIEQESACKPDAVSRVGAQGLAQFMPTTAQWFSQEYMGLPPEPMNPYWAIRALVQYDKNLWDQVHAVDTCNRMAKSLSSYNGGLKWIARDEKLAAERGYDPMVWFDSVALVNSGRSAANWKENRGYPKRILKKIEPNYVASGYGKGACNE